MQYSKKTISYLIAALFILGGYLFFKIWVQKGFLIINHIQPPYMVNFPDFALMTCNNDPCKLSVKPSNYDLTLYKKGYYELNKTISIGWQEETVWEPEIIKIPALKQLAQIPEFFQEKFSPIPNVGGNPYAIRNDGTVFYYNLNSGVLYQGTGQSKQLLAKFQDLQQPILSLGDDVVLLYTPQELFEVHIDRKRKYRIYYGENIDSVKIDKNVIFLETDRGLYVRLANKEDFRLLQNAQKSSLACVDNDGNVKLISLTMRNNEYDLLFWNVNVENFTEVMITGAQSQSKPVKINCDNPSSIQFMLENQEVMQLDF